MKHLLLLLFFSCGAGYGQEEVADYNSYIIAQQLIKKLNVELDTVYFSLDADNRYMETLYEKNLLDSIFVKQEQSNAWLSKRKVSQSSIELINEIFSRENYVYIQPQLSKSVWESSKIKYKPIKLLDAIERPKYSNRSYIELSKPVFTKTGKYALVSYRYNGTLALTIFESVNNKWEQIKFIPLGFI